MGNEVDRGGWAWRSVTLISRALDGGEREVVIGDLEESRATASRALGEVAGLVVRRQSELWLDWRPWITLVALTVPLGLLLSFISASWVESRAASAWWYAANWSERANRATIADEIVSVSTSIVLAYAALVGWGWAIAYAIRSLSPKTAWAHVMLLGLLVYVGEVGGLPSSGRFAPGVGVAVLLFKMLVLAIAVWHGLRTGDKQIPVPRAAVILLLLLTLGTWDWARSLYNAVALDDWRRISPWPGVGGRLGHHDDPLVWAMRVIPAVLMWPALFAAGRAFRQSLRRTVQV